MNEGIKESEGKLMTMELDSRFTKEMAKVMTINKAKYPRGNKYKDIDPSMFSILIDLTQDDYEQEY